MFLYHFNEQKYRKHRKHRKHTSNILQTHFKHTSNMDQHNIMFLFILISSLLYIHTITNISDDFLDDVCSLEPMQISFSNELNESMCNNPLSNAEFKINFYDVILISNAVHKKMQFLELYQSSIVLSIILIVISTIYLVFSLMLTSLKYLEDLYKSLLV